MIFSLWDWNIWGALGESVSVFGSQCIKLKMFNLHIFKFKKRTSATSESTCLCPIVELFLRLVLGVVFFVKGFD